MKSLTGYSVNEFANGKFVDSHYAQFTKEEAMIIARHYKQQKPDRKFSIESPGGTIIEVL